MVTADAKYFKVSELKHPEIVNPRAFALLDLIREAFGKPITITDDGRPAGTLPPGASKTSLHFKGQAFDLRSKHWTPGDLWAFVYAVQAVADSLAPSETGVELELVKGPTDSHCHVGFYLDGRANRMVLALD